jgi:hypothetical protein
MLAIDPEYMSQPSAQASTAEPNRNPKYDPKKPHITDTPITKKNWYKHVNWLNVSTRPRCGCLNYAHNAFSRFSSSSVSL